VPVDMIQGCCRDVFEDVGGVVVSVEDPLGLEVGDGALDSVADLTDDSVPCVVSPVQVPAWWLTPGVFTPVPAQPLSPVPGRPGMGDSSVSGASSRPEALMGVLD